MTEEPIIKRIAIAIIALSLIHIALWASLVGPRGIGSSILGLIINVVLCYFLVAGHGWARWWTAIRCFVGGLMSFSAFSSLGGMGLSVFSTIRLWLLFTAVVTMLIGFYLCFSSRVNKHYNPGSGW
jgi:hypothetical protein